VRYVVLVEAGTSVLADADRWRRSCARARACLAAAFGRSLQRARLSCA
jgi:hypothetical protein